MLGRVLAASHNGGTKVNKHRRLRLALLDQIARSGQILLRAQHDIPDKFDTLLRQFSITKEDACDLIAVHQSLDLIKQAEQWEHDLGINQVPSSAREALDLLARWRKTRH